MASHFRSINELSPCFARSEKVTDRFSKTLNRTENLRPFEGGGENELR